MPKVHYVSRNFLRKIGLTSLPWHLTSSSSPSSSSSFHFGAAANGPATTSTASTASPQPAAVSNRTDAYSTPIQIDGGGEKEERIDAVTTAKKCIVCQIVTAEKKHAIDNDDGIAVPPPFPPRYSLYSPITIGQQHNNAQHEDSHTSNVAADNINSKKRNIDKASNSTPLKKKVAKRDNTDCIVARSLVALESDEDKDEGDVHVVMGGDGRKLCSEGAGAAFATSSAWSKEQKMDGVEAINLQIITEGRDLPMNNGEVTKGAPYHAPSLPMNGESNLTEKTSITPTSSPLANANFCRMIRYARNNPEKSSMVAATDDRINSDIEQFAQRIDDLKAYKEKHGHVNVKWNEDKSLYVFCYNIRQVRKNPDSHKAALTDDRIASLDALGFNWIVQKHATKKSFAQRIEDVQAYKEKHGHTNVKKKDDKSLYYFCCNIRKARNNPEKPGMVINEERIASLDALGFDWSNRHGYPNSFAQQTEEIGAMIYASSNTASARKAAAEVESALTSDQSSSSYEPRSEVRNRKILSNSSSNSKEMESAPKTKRILKSFEQRMDDLRAYKERHGHINVSQSKDKSLSSFCYNMRQARKYPEKSTVALTDDRIASLDALGFEWIPERGRNSFDQRIADLRAYKEKNGHVNVKGSEDKSLYDFCTNMRRARNNPEKSGMLINDERIASLDALGFDWTPERGRNSFDQRIADLRAYKEKNGHVNVKGSEDKSLYDFCHNVRYARINPEKSTMVLNDVRIASLDALGFEWNRNRKHLNSELKV